MTNDRFRDWAEAHPEVPEPGIQVRGSWRDKVLDLLGLEPAGDLAGDPGAGEDSR